MFARPGLPAFDYVRPRTSTEVVDLLLEHGDAARLLMGGTDLLPRMRDGQLHPRLVLDVKHLPGMEEIRLDRLHGLTIGAAVTLNRLAASADVRAAAPLLSEAAASVASYQVRNRATLGGNLANASPAADTAPAVLVLDGRLLLHGPTGPREVPAADFFLGPGRTALRPGEFLAAVRLPPPPPRAAGTYLKLGRTKAGDLAVAGVAVYGFPDPSPPSGLCFRLALAAVAPVPLRARAAEEVLEASAPSAGPGDILARAAEAAAKASSPIDDLRAGADYRRAMVRVLALRGLTAVWAVLDGDRLLS